MLTPARAREIHDKQSNFPYWGNYTKFMTPDEESYVMDLWKKDTRGNITVAMVVQRIMKAADNGE